ncbi:hypothetical protein [Pseudonocardia alni]|uniref:hypothetical protein n=1 Tax=Pseudonocardia alni TaxID=33907 RepID=UPI0033332D49
MRLATPSTEITDAAEQKQTLRELDRRTTNARSGVENLGASARHVWQVAISISPNTTTKVTGTPTVYRDDAVARFGADGNLVLTQPGRWFVGAYVDSDRGAASAMTVSLNQTATGGDVSEGGSQDFLDGLGALIVTNYRGAGFSNAGRLRQSVTWSGVVTPEEAANPVVFQVYDATSATGAMTVTFRIIANFLGGVNNADDDTELATEPTE